MDIVQNSVNAKSTLIEIMVDFNKIEDLCTLEITDNGCGMDSETLKQATNPFFTTRKTRKVGLGLSLLKQNAEMSRGKFSIKSAPQKGTTVKAVFQTSNIDRPELGDVWNTFYLCMLGNDNIEFTYQHKTEKGSFKISSGELKESIEGVSIQQKEIREAITDYIKNNITELQ
jgi:hypothetical protein